MSLDLLMVMETIFVKIHEDNREPKISSNLKMPLS